jgi:tetratricopeptide (TPR) repeat protein
LKPCRVALVAALVAAACAAPVRPRFPDGEEYAFPVAQPGELRPEEAKRIDEAWRDVLQGESASAEKDFLKLLARHPALIPAETGLGFARLRAQRFADAARTFESVLARRPDYVPALIGAGSSAVRRGEPEAALQWYRRAQALRPDDAVVRRRLAEVKLRITERRVAAGRAAQSAGESERAIEEYRAALAAAPEVGGLRVELADVLVGRGDLPGAVAVLEADPGGDRQVLLRLGELLTDLKEHQRALEAYRRILARDPKDAEALRRALAARQTLELLQMPEEYRRIYTASRITRADLAALVAVKVGALQRATPGEPKVAVDISGSWAREHIIKVLAFDVMEVYPNHSFQPGAIVRRGELARAVGRILDLVKWPSRPAPSLKDMSASNLFYDGTVRAVSAGLMDLTPDGAFEPWRPVAGQDALAVIEALTRLIGP